MVRYEIEKQLLAGTLEVKDIPSEWNRLYKEYLGVDVPNDAQGCLQDCHWSMGLIGYFPSYALGTAYGAQMLAKMQEEFDVFGQVEQGDISNIENWLIENIQKHGGLYKPVELLEKAFGGFDPKYYTEYLKDKFTALYNL